MAGRKLSELLDLLRFVILSETSACALGASTCVVEGSLACSHHYWLGKAFLSLPCVIAIVQIIAAAYFLFPPSSSMYIISCLKIKRLGAPSRVSRTIFLS